MIELSPSNVYAGELANPNIWDVLFNEGNVPYYARENLKRIVYFVDKRKIHLSELKISPGCIILRIKFDD